MKIEKFFVTLHQIALTVYQIRLALFGLSASNFPNFNPLGE
jgi:hypothetical protein